MGTKDIFGNGNNEEEIILSSIDSSYEDTYGLNAFSKVDHNSGSGPIIAEIENLNSENINLIYSTDNIGDDTDILVSSPLLLNKTTTPNQLFRQQVIDFSKTDIDSLTGNNKNNPLVGTFELDSSTPKYAINTE